MIRRTLLVKSQIIGHKCYASVRARSFGILHSSFPAIDERPLSSPFSQFLLTESCATKFMDQTAFVDGVTEKTLSFTELRQSAIKFGTELYYNYRIQPNDVVAIYSPNDLHYFSAFIGISNIRAISTCINPLYTESEVLYQLKATNAKMIVCHAICLEKVSNIIKSGGLPEDFPVVVLDSNGAITPSNSKIFEILPKKSTFMSDILGSKAFTPAHYDAIAESLAKIPFDASTAVLTIPFSSGTTGKSKGVMLTHRNIAANILQFSAIEGLHLVETAHQSRATILSPLPFFHIFGLTAAMLVSYYTGAKLVFMPAFDLQRYLALVEKYKVTRSFVVPPIITALLKHPIVDNYDLSSLNVLFSGAAPLGGDVQVACGKRLNCFVKQAWGMTELSPGAAVTPDGPLESMVDLNGTSGPLLPSTEAKIVHPETGADMEYTSEGEILIRGPQVMLGYLNDAESTTNTIRPDGFMHTGDIGHFDSKGWMYVTDRKKELIKYKGFQVPPAELEALILTMDVVKDAIVIPVLDDEAGEVPRAYVVKQPNCPSDFSVDDVIEYIHARVAPYKRLRGGVRFCEEIPKSATGKLLRRVQIDRDRALNSP